jgi:toxin ParE1/3/4
VAEVKVLWSDQSITDLEEMISYIARDSPAAARNFATKIIDATTVLETFATIGRIVPEYSDASLREILYRNYRIVYQLSDNTATIVTVFHGSRPLA